MAVSNKRVKENLRAMVQHSDGDALVVEGLEKQAKSIRRHTERLKELEAELKQEEQEFRTAVTAQRTAAEAKGQFYKTCRVLAGDEDPVTVSWKDAYGTLDTKNEPLLKQAFGDRYATFFGRQITLKPNPGVSRAMISKALGEEAWETLQQFCEVGEEIRLRGKVMEARADLKQTASPEIYERITIVLDAKQHKPQVRC